MCVCLCVCPRCYRIFEQHKPTEGRTDICYYPLRALTLYNSFEAFLSFTKFPYLPSESITQCNVNFR